MNDLMHTGRKTFGLSLALFGFCAVHAEPGQAPKTSSASFSKKSSSNRICQIEMLAHEADRIARLQTLDNLSAVEIFHIDRLAAQDPSRKVRAVAMQIAVNDKKYQLFKRSGYSHSLSDWRDRADALDVFYDAPTPEEEELLEVIAHSHEHVGVRNVAQGILNRFKKDSPATEAPNYSIQRFEDGSITDDATEKSRAQYAKSVSSFYDLVHDKPEILADPAHARIWGSEYTHLFHDQIESQHCDSKYTFIGDAVAVEVLPTHSTVWNRLARLVLSKYQAKLFFSAELSFEQQESAFVRPEGIFLDPQSALNVEEIPRHLSSLLAEFDLDFRMRSGKKSPYLGSFLSEGSSDLPGFFHRDNQHGFDLKTNYLGLFQIKRTWLDLQTIVEASLDIDAADRDEHFYSAHLLHLATLIEAGEHYAQLTEHLAHLSLEQFSHFSSSIHWTVPQNAHWPVVTFKVDDSTNTEEPFFPPFYGMFPLLSQSAPASPEALSELRLDLEDIRIDSLALLKKYRHLDRLSQRLRATKDMNERLEILRSTDIVDEVLDLSALAKN